MFPEPVAATTMPARPVANRGVERVAGRLERRHDDLDGHGGCRRGRGQRAPRSARSEPDAALPHPPQRRTLAGREGVERPRRGAWRRRRPRGSARRAPRARRRPGPRPRAATRTASQQVGRAVPARARWRCAWRPSRRPAAASRWQRSQAKAVSSSVSVPWTTTTPRTRRVVERAVDDARGCGARRRTRSGSPASGPGRSGRRRRVGRGRAPRRAGRRRRAWARRRRPTASTVMLMVPPVKTTATRGSGLMARRATGPAVASGLPAAARCRDHRLPGLDRLVGEASAGGVARARDERHDPHEEDDARGDQDDGHGSERVGDRSHDDDRQEAADRDEHVEDAEDAPANRLRDLRLELGLGGDRGRTRSRCRPRRR